MDPESATDDAMPPAATANSFGLRSDGDCDLSGGVADRDDVIEDAALGSMAKPSRRGRCLCCCIHFPRGCGCRCTYRVPSARELFDRDKRLLRAILLIVVLLNVPIGEYILYPFTLFSTWIHELFHGLAALSVGGRIAWLNIYPDGSGLANTLIPVGKFPRAWVAGAGYQGTAIVGGIMLMFRRTASGARIGTCVVGIAMLLTSLILVRNVFGLVAVVFMGAGLVLAGWKLPSFWVAELYAILSATTCLNAITSVRVLFFVTESSIGGVTRSSDAITMQEVSLVPYWIWATIWMVLALWMSVLGVLIVAETNECASASEGNSASEGRPLAMETGLT